MVTDWILSVQLSKSGTSIVRGFYHRATLVGAYDGKVEVLAYMFHIIYHETCLVNHFFHKKVDIIHMCNSLVLLK